MPSGATTERKIVSKKKKTKTSAASKFEIDGIRGMKTDVFTIDECGNATFSGAILTSTPKGESLFNKLHGLNEAISKASKAAIVAGGAMREFSKAIKPVKYDDIFKTPIINPNSFHRDGIDPAEFMRLCESSFTKEPTGNKTMSRGDLDPAEFMGLDKRSPAKEPTGNKTMNGVLLGSVKKAVNLFTDRATDTQRLLSFYGGNVTLKFDNGTFRKTALEPCSMRLTGCYDGKRQGVIAQFVIDQSAIRKRLDKPGNGVAFVEIPLLVFDYCFDPKAVCDLVTTMTGAVQTHGPQVKADLYSPLATASLSDFGVF
jgi:hypothetical protein